MRGFSLNLWLAAFNLLPFGPMDGAKVFKWNPLVWGIITVPAWIASLFLI
jgi:Zn-dependent protease